MKVSLPKKSDRSHFLVFGISASQCGYAYTVQCAIDLVEFHIKEYENQLWNQSHLCVCENAGWNFLVDNKYGDYLCFGRTIISPLMYIRRVQLSVDCFPLYVTFQTFFSP